MPPIQSMSIIKKMHGIDYFVVIAQNLFFLLLHLHHNFLLFNCILAATSDNQGVNDLDVGTNAFACKADEIQIGFAFGIQAVTKPVCQNTILFAYQKDVSLKLVEFGADIAFSFQQ